MRDRGLILLDTKYEFGVDENGVLHVIDEVRATAVVSHVCWSRSTLPIPLACVM